MNIKLEYAITQMVELLLPRFSPEDKVFHVCVVAKFSLYGDDEDRLSTKQIHFLFQRPSNYTKVFILVNDNKYTRLEEIPSNGWTLKSDHDSCWRSDGVGSPLFKAWCELRNQFQEEDWKKISEFVSFGFMSPALYKAELTAIPNNDPWDRKYTIKLGEKIDGSSQSRHPNSDPNKIK